MSNNTYVQAVNMLLKDFSKESYRTDKNDNTYAHEKFFSDIVYAVTHNSSWLTENICEYGEEYQRILTVDRDEVGAEEYIASLSDEIRIKAAQIVEYDIIANTLKAHLKSEYDYDYDRKRTKGRKPVPKEEAGKRKDETLAILKKLKV